MAEKKNDEFKTKNPRLWASVGKEKNIGSRTSHVNTWFKEGSTARKMRKGVEEFTKSLEVDGLDCQG